MASFSVQAQTWNLAGNAGINPANDFIGTTDAKALRLRTNNLVRVNIAPSGNVGIGTQTPADRLHVSNGHLRVESSIANDSSILVLNQATSNCNIQYRVGNIGRAYTGYDVSTATFVTSVSTTGTRPDLTIRASNGYAGLGTSNALYPLHLVGTSSTGFQYDGATGGYAGSYMNATDTANGRPFYGYKIGNSTKGWTYMDKTGKFSIYNGGDRLVVLNNGNIGIGTSTPDARLHVGAGTDASAASGGYLVTGLLTSENLVMDNNEIMARNNGATATLYFNHSGGNIAMCSGGGQVTIGTATPASGYLLSVDGKVMAEEIRVELSGNWPDYVFGKDYNLPSIEEVEKTISEKGHLPNMPSAKEVETTGGFQVGEMQTKLLEKVEELTLYIIQLKKENDVLKSRVDAMSK
ncbi:MAG: hypothetical protein IPO27_10325 [Bacteroidetes bacterium]|nr:hypothetical protein [Bacteroidota bacterium]